MTFTQQEIVQRLGISRGTLHRVLSGSPLVKPSTRERVLRELEKWNYVPNVLARGLKTRSTMTIGLIGPASLRMSNIDKLNAIHRAARARGYSIALGYSDGSPDADEHCIRELLARMVDGFVAIGRGLEEVTPVYQKLLVGEFPLVTLYPLPGLDADCVYVDTRQAYRELAQHFLNLGHRDIGLVINASRSLFTVNRELGYRDALDGAGLPINEDWIIRVTPDGNDSHKTMPEEMALWEMSDYQVGYWGMSLLLARRKRPSAVIMLSDESAIGALCAADQARVDVPGEIAMAGYDDKEPARFARVPLTTMHQPDEQIGEEAVSLLIDRIEGKLSDGPIVRPLSAGLVVRDSCGARR